MIGNGFEILVGALTWFGVLIAACAVLTAKGRKADVGFILAYIVCAPAALFYAAFVNRA